MQKNGYDNTQVSRNYYLNLFSAAAEKTTNADGSKNVIFKWNIRDLQLGTQAEIALVQMAHTAAVNATQFTMRCLETYADGYDSYNTTSAVLYCGIGLNQPSIPTFHKLISQNLNTITLIMTDDNSSSTAVNAGINTNITFSCIFQVIDYLDSQNTF